MWPCPAVAGTRLATRKRRGVDRHGFLENGLRLRRGGYESGFETVKCYTNARWYFYLCHLRLENAGREKAGDGLDVCSAGAV